MPYFDLSKEEIAFPPAHFADLDGLVATGGDLSVQRLVLAYNSGIYYWHFPLKQIKWWSPDPRTVLVLDSFKFSPDRLQHLEGQFTALLSNDLEQVFRACQKFYNIRDRMDNNWLSERAFRSFMELHQKGLVQVVEVWKDNLLVGGLFGVAIGKMFFGEYLFSEEQDAGEFALLFLIKNLKEKEFYLIDMQKETMLTAGFEYDELSRIEYVSLCKENAEKYKDSYKQV